MAAPSSSRLPLGVLLRVATFNVFAHKVKTLLVAGIIAFGTTLVVVGNSLLDSVTVSMSHSIVYSIAGHLQVYSADAKDELALFGGMLMGAEDIGQIDDFARLKAVVAPLPNVESIVPMGLDTALVFTGNPIDTTLAGLRRAVGEGDAVAVTAKQAHARRMVEILQKQLGNLGDIATEGALEPADLQAVAQAADPAFWAEFDRNPLSQLEFLENRIAPLSLGERLQFFRYVGTDLEAFREHFDLFEIVDGTPVPAGQHGFLFNKFVYETVNKNPIAMRIDRVADERANGRSLATDEELQQLIARNGRQTNDILLELDPVESAEVESELREFLAADAPPDSDLPALLEAFLAFDETNFDARKAAFYSIIGNRITLYQVPVGGMITLTSYGRSGYVRSINVQVYGTFAFRSLEKSALSGSFNLLDLMSFRDLYGFGSAAQEQELLALKSRSGAQDVDRDDAEDALFGGDAELVVEGAVRDFDEFAGVDMSAVQTANDELMNRVYTQDEIDGGVALNAAILLRDPTQLEATRAEIEAAMREAGLSMKTATWQEASGLVGQFVAVTRLSLYAAILIIFVVALLIVNISTLMAALERVSEIGTMRAIGAGRLFVLALILLESLVVAFIGGIAGAVAGVSIVLYLGHIGIPAFSDIFYFLFSGPRLYPELTADTLGVALLVLLTVSVLASLYPAIIATRITPLSAIQTED